MIALATIEFEVPEERCDFPNILKGGTTKQGTRETKAFAVVLLFLMMIARAIEGMKSLKTC
jgi:hypothetical protein